MVRVKYCNRDFYLKPYNVKQEQNALLQFSEDNFNDLTMDTLLSNLGLDLDFIKKLTNLEKYYIFYQLRSISVSPEVELNLKCNCGCSMEINFNCSDILEEGTLDSNFCKNVLSDNIDDFFGGDYGNLDDLTLENYDLVVNYIDENRSRIKNIFFYECPNCKSEKIINIFDPAVLGKSISDLDIMNVFKTTRYLISNGKYTFSEVMEMLPAERTIHSNLLSNDIEEMNKKKQNSNTINVNDFNNFKF